MFESAYWEPFHVSGRDKEPVARIPDATAHEAIPDGLSRPSDPEDEASEFELEFELLAEPLLDVLCEPPPKDLEPVSQEAESEDGQQDNLSEMLRLDEADVPAPLPELPSRDSIAELIPPEETGEPAPLPELPSRDSLAELIPPEETGEPAPLPEIPSLDSLVGLLPPDETGRPAPLPELPSSDSLTGWIPPAEAGEPAPLPELGMEALHVSMAATAIPLPDGVDEHEPLSAGPGDSPGNDFAEIAGVADQDGDDEGAEVTRCRGLTPSGGQKAYSPSVPKLSEEPTSLPLTGPEGPPRRLAEEFGQSPTTERSPRPGGAVEDPQTNIWAFSDVPITGRASEVLGKLVIADRYLVLEDLGQGGMARIHKVKHLALGKEFALKIIHEEMSTDAQMRKNFFREARLASQMDHPNIVQVTDFGVDPEFGSYIVMEYLKGETLFKLLSREARLRLSLALDVALQVAEALHYMHQKDIIHCDIKPENLFLVRTTAEQRKRVQVKLIDFGLSRRMALGAQLARSEVGGTPHYMAPEQIRGLAPQPSMDIYALGILLYEMVTGKPPFDGSVSELISAQILEAPTPPSERLSEPLDERVEALILKLLAKNPEDRQPSMGQVIYEIRTLMEMLGLRSGRRRPAVERPTPPASSDARDEQPRIVFEHCPCPLFRIDTQCRLLAANPALCTFLGQRPEALVGRSLHETRLGLVYPTLPDEVRVSAGALAPLQCVVSFQKDPRAVVSVMVWLVPEIDESSGAISFTGIILPAPGEGQRSPSAHR